MNEVMCMENPIYKSIKRKQLEHQENNMSLDNILNKYALKLFKTNKMTQ